MVLSHGIATICFKFINTGDVERLRCATVKHISHGHISDIMVKVKQSRYRPGVAQRVPGS